MNGLIQYLSLVFALSGALTAATPPPDWVPWFTDNFEDGTTRKWKFWKDPAEQQANWRIERDGENQLMVGRGHIFATPISVRGSNYRLKARVRLISGNVQMNVRDNCERFDANFGGNRIVLSRTMPCGQHTQLRVANQALELRRWYVFEVVVIGNEVEILVDGESKLTLTDTGPAPLFGGLNFESLPNTVVHVDDVEVTGAPPRGREDLRVVDVVLPRTAPELAYEYQLTAAGGTPPYTWAAPRASYVPPGFSLSPEGVLSGKAPVTGRFYPALFAVVDSSGTRAMEAFEFMSEDEMITTPRTLPSGEVGKEYQVALEVVAPQPCSWVALNMAPGLTLNARTGVLSGVPSMGGTYSMFTICLDAEMDGPDRVFSLHVAEPEPAPLALATRVDEIGDISMLNGTPYTALRATGGIPPYSWAITGGELTPGLRLLQGAAVPKDEDGYGAVIGGYPWSETEFTFTLEVTDSVGAKAVGDYTVRTALIGVDGDGDDVGVLGAPFSLRLRAENAVGATTWAPIIVPAGLELTPEGEVKGVLAECGMLRLIAEVTDSANPPVTLRFAGDPGLAVLCRPDSLLQLDISVPEIARAKIGEPFSMRFGIGNGTGSDYRLAVESGAMAPGLALTEGSAPGVYLVSGTPTETGTFDAFLRATDSGDNIGVRRLRVVVE